MLNKGAIQETIPRGQSYLSTIFLVWKKDGSPRIVIKRKSLNKLVHTENFKIEGTHPLKDFLKKEIGRQRWI